MILRLAAAIVSLSLCVACPPPALTLDGGGGAGGGAGGIGGGDGGGAGGGVGGGTGGGVGGGAGGGVGGGAPDAGPGCTPVVAGMLIAQSTTLCPGTYRLSVAPGSFAVGIVGDDVVLTCDKTELENSGFGTTEQPTVGIAVGPQKHVSVKDCTARGFRYGVVARGSTDLSLQDLILDDNFHAPDAGWVQDTVQGGGIRFEGVDGGQVLRASIKRTWNAIELRSGTRNVSVSHSVADHCSNTGVTIVESHDNELADNDFSWAIRGANLVFPYSWYGIDTRDSAGLILDSSSSGNRVLRNDFRYGGDGVFLRSVIGGCAVDNLIQGNDTSFSPHNAIESWCDGNSFLDNIASDSHYGVWLGGTDRGLVRGNKIERNKVDGVSIQIGENRHSVIEGNEIRDNGRVGILLTGREYQAWDALTHWGPNLANSSHLVVQGNTVERNGATDVFVTSTRSLILASNCGADGGIPRLQAGTEAELIETIGSCGGAAGRPSPTAVLAVPTSALLGAATSLSAAGSAPGVPGDPIGYTWLVQPSGLRFTPATLPVAVVARDGAQSESITFTAPGLFDVDLTVNDGHRAAIASKQLAVLPVGRAFSDAPAQWSATCVSAPACSTSVGVAPGLDGEALHVVTNAPYEFVLSSPPAKNLALDAAAFTRLGMFIRARNPNGGGWQLPSPVLVLGGSAGTLRYQPANNLQPTDPSEWIFISIPLAGGAGWTRTGVGSLTMVDWIELHTDTYGFEPVELWIDSLVMY